MTNPSGEFEKALGRLEEIVTKLERETVGLDESVALFNEGKQLARKCEMLLKAGFGVSGTGSAELKKLIDIETAKWRDVIAAGNLKVN